MLAISIALLLGIIGATNPLNGSTSTVQGNVPMKKGNPPPLPFPPPVLRLPRIKPFVSVHSNPPNSTITSADPASFDESEDYEFVEAFYKLAEVRGALLREEEAELKDCKDAAETTNIARRLWSSDSEPELRQQEHKEGRYVAFAYEDEDPVAVESPRASPIPSPRASPIRWYSQEVLCKDRVPLENASPRPTSKRSNVLPNETPHRPSFSDDLFGEPDSSSSSSNEGFTRRNWDLSERIEESPRSSPALKSVRGNPQYMESLPFKLPSLHRSRSSPSVSDESDQVKSRVSQRRRNSGKSKSSTRRGKSLFEIEPELEGSGSDHSLWRPVKAKKQKKARVAPVQSAHLMVASVLASKELSFILMGLIIFIGILHRPQSVHYHYH